jgi:WD40 repeat protein
MEITILEALEKFTLFEHYNEEQLEELSQHISVKALEAGEILFRAGEPGDALYMVVSGEIEIFSVEQAGQDLVFNEIIEGGFFGEMALLDNKPRSAGSRAREDSQLLALDAETVQSLFGKDPIFSKHIVGHVSNRLRANLDTGTHKRVQAGEVLDRPANKPVDPHEHAPDPDGRAVSTFISYSRKDTEFIRKLHVALEANGITTWVDWEGIKLGTDWWQEIVGGIQSTDNFIFVVSPDSVESEVCADELKAAIENSKRLIPVVFREDKNTVGQVDKSLQAINFTFMRTDEEFNRMLPGLIELLNTDLEHVQRHTRIQERALEWNAAGQSSGLTLRGSDLDEAELWFTQAASKEPPPTVLQGEFLHTSRVQVANRQRRTLVGISVALVVTIVLTIFSLFQFQQARIHEQEALDERAVAEVASTKAISQQQTAEAASTIAVEHENEAIAQQGTAEAASTVAVQQEQEAIEQANAALTAQAEANAQRSIADSQRELAEARELVAAAENAADQGTLLTRGMLLAIAALKSVPSLDAIEIIRKGLDILPFLEDQQVLEVEVDLLAYDPNNDIVALISGPEAIITDPLGERFSLTVHHDADITAAEFSLDGRWLATAGEDHSVRIWDPLTGIQLGIFTHDGPVRALSFNSGTPWLVSGGDDGFVRIWNPGSGDVIASFRHSGAVNDVAFSTSGTWVASGSDDNRLVIFQTTTGELIHQIFHPEAVDVVEFGINSDYIAAADRSGTVYVYNPFTGGQYSQLSHEQSVTAIRFSPDNEFIASTSLDRTTRIWDPVSGIAISRLGHNSRVLDVDFSADGQFVATASADGTGRVWNTASGRELAILEHDDDVTGVVFLEQGNRVLTASKDHHVRIWDFQGVSQALARFDHPAGVVDLDLNATTGVLATVALDNTIRLWDVETGTLLHLLNHDNFIGDIDFNSGGTRIAAAAVTGEVFIWDIDAERIITEFSVGAEVTDVDYSKSDEWLAFSSVDGNAYIWDVATEEIIAIFKAGGPIGEIAVSDDGTILAAASLDGTARLWNTDTGEELLRLEHLEGVILVELFQDRQILVTASLDNAIRVWNTSTGKLISRFQLDTEITSIDISADGTRIVTSGEDNSARVWDFASGDEVARLQHPALIVDVELTKNNELITASLDRTAQISTLAVGNLVDKACSRLLRNLTQDEWSNFFGDLAYAATCENLPASPSAIAFLREQAGELAITGDQAGAIALLEQVLALDPSLSFDPEEETNELIKNELIRRAAEFALDGDFPEALSLYADLKTSYPELETDEFSALTRLICDLASTTNGAIGPSLEICSAAIGFEPTAASHYDSRARLHVRNGDFQAAIQDFEMAIMWMSADTTADPLVREGWIADRMGWIDALSQGINPFE